MSQKKISYISDKLLWLLISLLPLFVYLIYCFKSGSTYSFELVFNDFGFGIDFENSVIYSTLTNIFGVSAGSISNMPAFTTNGLMLYATYLTYVELIHLLIACLLYIPRIAQKWLNKGVE